VPALQDHDGDDFGPYRLSERLAVGGMAELFVALEPRAVGEPRRVVIKRMLPEISQQPGGSTLFEEEARLSALFDHPNVVKLLSSGRHEGTPFLALELVPGVDLGRLLRWLMAQGRTVDPGVALHVLRNVLNGLATVHEAEDPGGRPFGIVHGDVSPSNILLSVTGEVKLADFGVARARFRPAMAGGSRARGKLAYLSPERVVGGDPDPRSDLFALGVVFAEMLLGHPLFGGMTELEMLLAIRDARIDAFDAAADLLPPPLVDMVRWVLRRDIDERPGSAAEWLAHLEVLERGDTSELASHLGQLVELVREGAKEEEGVAEEETTRELEHDDVDEPSLDVYRVRRSDGALDGPFTFAELVQELTTGNWTPAEMVCRAGEPYRAFEELDELAPHLPPSWFEQTTRDRSPHPPEDDRVTGLQDGAIVGLLARAVLSRETGVWIFTREEVRKEVYLLEGIPEFVSSNVPAELLGEFLVRRGVLTRGELDMALAVLPRFDGRLGDTLSALGLIEPVDLFRHLQDQVHDKLLQLFLWPDGRARFVPDVPAPPRRFPLRLDPWRILQEGVDRRLAAGLEQDTFGPRFMDSLGRTGTRLPQGAPPEVAELVGRLANPMPLHALVEQLEDRHERDLHRPYRAIRLGLALGVVDFLGGPGTTGPP
jgi:serine/threonine protein kinase